MAYSDVTAAHKIAYRANVELAIQQSRSQFTEAFMFSGDLQGRQTQVVDIVGKTTAIVDGNRGGDTPNIEGSHDSVWVTPRQIEWGKIIEKEDAIKALTDFKSPYVQAGAAAVVRARDDILAAAIFGSKLTGRDGTTTTTYSNTGRLVAEDVGGTGAQGMNVKKILRAFRYLETQDVDVTQEDLYLALNPTEIEQLYNDVTYVNKDYRDKAVLEEKRVLSILGVQIISTMRLPMSDSDTHRAALFSKRAMVWGEFDPIQTIIERNPQKKYRWHPYVETWVGAVRAMDELVIEILNNTP